MRAPTWRHSSRPEPGSGRPGSHVVAGHVHVFARTSAVAASAPSCQTFESIWAPSGRVRTRPPRGTSPTRTCCRGTGSRPSHVLRPGRSANTGDLVRDGPATSRLRPSHPTSRRRDVGELGASTHRIRSLHRPLNGAARRRLRPTLRACPARWRSLPARRDRERPRGSCPDRLVPGRL
jgi:hypothetical protein